MLEQKSFPGCNKPQGMNMSDEACAKVHFYLDCGLIAAMCIGIAAMISFLTVL